MSAAAVTADRGLVAGIAVTSAALLMTELVLTRIFSVTMFYHFAFLAISIALLGLSASGVFVYVARRRLASRPTRELLWKGALLHAAATLLAVGPIAPCLPAPFGSWRRSITFTGGIGRLSTRFGILRTV